MPSLTTRSALLGAITIALAHSAHGQATLLSDVRRASATSQAGATDSFSTTPSTPFADFTVPARTTAASSETASVTSSVSHASTVSTTAFRAKGAASASGVSTGFDPGSAQASSSFFISFRLPREHNISLAATLTSGPVSSAQLFLQKSDGAISYIFSGANPQPVSLARVLPAGDYTLVVVASASIALYPSANLNDGCDFTMSFDMTPVCPADFNSDGFLDFFDYDEYVNCFENGACPPGKTADFNNDAFVDFFDYDDFVQAFEQGC